MSSLRNATNNCTRHESPPTWKLQPDQLLCTDHVICPADRPTWWPDPVHSASGDRTPCVMLIASLHGTVRDGLQHLACRNPEGWQSRAMRQLFFDKGETFAACRFFAFSVMLSRIEHRPPELHRLSA